jgi:tRNA threonylcarbamoyladenosine biosynthesis protein TsaE
MHSRLEGSHLIARAEDEAATMRLGNALGGLLRPGDVVGLVGELGAGKTCLARAVAGRLGVAPEEVTSPTFVLIHEYAGQVPLYHFDAYRLRSPDQFQALGVDEYWRAGGICLVEWADRVAELLPRDAWWVRIEHLPSGGRQFQVEAPAEELPRLKRLHEAL